MGQRPYQGHSPTSFFPARRGTASPHIGGKAVPSGLEDAGRYHLDAIGSAPSYDPGLAGVAADLRGPQEPIAPVLARIDPALATPVRLSSTEFDQLIAFLRNGLLDPRANAEYLRKLIPARVPSGRPIHVFE